MTLLKTAGAPDDSEVSDAQLSAVSDAVSEFIRLPDPSKDGNVSLRMRAWKRNLESESSAIDRCLAQKRWDLTPDAHAGCQRRGAEKMDAAAAEGDNFDSALPGRESTLASRTKALSDLQSRLHDIESADEAQRQADRQAEQQAVAELAAAEQTESSDAKTSAESNLRAVSMRLAQNEAAAREQQMRRSALEQALTAAEQAVEEVRGVIEQERERSAAAARRFIAAEFDLFVSNMVWSMVNSGRTFKKIYLPVEDASCVFGGSLIAAYGEGLNETSLKLLVEIFGTNRKDAYTRATEALAEAEAFYAAALATAGDSHSAAAA